MSEGKHTPAPLEIWQEGTESDPSYKIHRVGYGSVFQTVGGNDKANAEHLLVCWNSFEALREACEQIAKAEGPYSRDRLTHAENTIRAMKEIAEAALAQAEKKESKMAVHIKSRWCNEEIDLMYGHYGNGSIAIRGYTLTGEPAFTATVALDECPLEGYVFLKGWGENKGIPEALEEAGIVKRTGRKIPTGYCEAEEAELLVEID